MQNVLGMCLNWKVLVGLAAVGVAVFVFAPGWGLAILPLLILAACPLSMLVMAFMMRGGMKGGHDASRENTVEAARARLDEVEQERARLRAQLERADEQAGSDSTSGIPGTAR
ncbi:MAG: DUF2933 domain-containing protein [Tepidiformaceae bacterium]